MNVAPIIRSKQDRILHRFQEADAMAPETARTPQEVGIRPSLVLHGLVVRGVIVAVDDRYYVDQEKAASWRSTRRRRVLLVVAAALLGALLFFWLS